MTSKRPTRLDYCQYLLVSQTNYTITNYADHTQNAMSHDAINRYLREDRLTSRLIWENVRLQNKAPRRKRRGIKDGTCLATLLK